MPYAGNVTDVRERDACYADYEELKRSALYGGAQNSFTAPSAESYVARLIREAPRAKNDVKGKLGVVTGVVFEQVGHHIALELAVQAEMHVLIMGKSERGLRNVVDAIHAAATQRGAPRPKLYIQRLYISSLESARTAAHQCQRLAHSEYNGEIHVVVHHASVGAAEARLTADGFEYNTGCNFLTTHYLTKEFLPLLRNAATETYKPRVVFNASMGHCLGHNFAPQRILYFPKEGGAPAGYIISMEDDQIRESGPTHGVDYTTAEKLAAVGKAGTQVGRSKMAVVADAIHWSRLYPFANFISHHTGALAVRNGGMAGLSPLFHLKMFVSRFTPSQGARSALRAALDPDFSLKMQGAYLHADGNPWVSKSPTTIDPQTGQPFTFDKFAETCWQVAETVIERRFEEIGIEERRETYSPPELVAEDSQGTAPTATSAASATEELSTEIQTGTDSQSPVSSPATEITEAVPQERKTLIHQGDDEDEEASWGTWIRETTGGSKRT